MGREMFNSYQNDYMDYLDTIPPEHKCYCGWYLLGQCSDCPAGKTCADKLKDQAEEVTGNVQP